MSLMATGTDFGPCTGEGVRDVVATRSSTIVFQAPHSGHLPVHFGDSAPHSLQNQVDLYLAFAISITFGVNGY